MDHQDVERQFWQELQEFAKNIKLESSAVEYRELAEPQIVLEHSPVGESQPNGSIQETNEYSRGPRMG